ncbi:MAG: DUF255 domain-containing protein [Candidatus Dadabacteria bacterium]|nr:MAG: DUF255 domain-containing protein [Candidatus Dadabacteria bacterium]
MFGRTVATLISAALVAATLVAAEPAAPAGIGTAIAGGDWNDGGIDWKGYEEGLALAAKSGKPVCLIFYTDWCPHCTNYSRVFHDDKVVEMAKKFVMVRINRDQNRELSAKYAPDGEYIPRTYFLSPKGELWASVHAPRAQFQYFYDEHNPGSLLEGMRTALGKLGKS